MTESANKPSDRCVSARPGQLGGIPGKTQGAEDLVDTIGRAGDLGRRVAHRREELGLTRGEVARRAGMASGYLDYLEHSSAVGTMAGGLMPLAAALETTPAALLGGGHVDQPPGIGRAGPHPRLEVLSREQCEAHLVAGGIGRFVFQGERGPVALPVNFRFVEGDVVFRTRAAGSLAAAGATVSFEVDHIDEAMSEGWSVLITGIPRRVNDPSELAEVARLGIEPWPGGRREAIIRVETDEMSGRNIRQEGSP